MEVRITCPLGSKCEEINVVDKCIDRCAWYVEIVGVDQQGNDHNESKCAMAWQPILSLEMAGTNRGQTEALTSFRDEVVKGTERTNKLLNSSTDIQGIGITSRDR